MKTHLPLEAAMGSYLVLAHAPLPCPTLSTETSLCVGHVALIQAGATFGSVRTLGSSPSIPTNCEARGVTPLGFGFLVHRTGILLDITGPHRTAGGIR